MDYEGALLKTGLTLRGDHWYCPLALQLSTYWSCENACRHCYLRRLNRTWGNDLRPLDVDLLLNQVKNGVKNPNPKSPLAAAIAARKTVYLGAKSDPYQPAEQKYGVTRKALQILLHYGFSVVIATKYTSYLERDRKLFEKYQPQVIIMPIISPGLERDWTELEKEGTTNPIARFADAQVWQNRGFKVGINGEPFIPGFHTVDEFKRAIGMVRAFGIKSYNTYNLHFNDWNAKEMNAAGIDVEAVWEGNQDKAWRPVLQELIEIAKEFKVVLGCPDFVNSGSYVEESNTCCGIDVPNPCTFNFIHWKKLRKAGHSDKDIIDMTWDGVGDLEYGKKLIKGEVKDLYTLDDIKGGLLDE